jgi:hypothetical protein
MQNQPGLSGSSLKESSMNGKWLGIFALVAAAALLFTLPSCGRSQQLVSLEIQPASETFGDTTTPVIDDAGLSVQLRALGSYIHPPVTKDITAQATWASNDTQMVTVDANGLATAVGIDCGSALISGTVTTNKSPGGESAGGAIITGYMTVNVTCFVPTGAAEGMTVNFSGSGSGIVTSSPLGLSCASTAAKCNSRFENKSPVTLTAVPNGKFAGWTGCDNVSASGLVCTVNDPGNRALAAAFN